MMKTSLKKNAMLNVVYKLSNIIFPLIVYPYISRILSAENLGKVSFFSSLTSYMLMVGSLGIATYGIRVVAKLRNDKRSLSIAVKELMVINMIVTGSILLILFCVTPFVDKFKQNMLILLVSCLQIALAPFSVEWLYSGLEQYEYIAKRSILIKGLSLILIFLIVKKRDDYIIYAAIITFAYIGNYLCNIIYAKNFVDFKIKAKLHFKEHLKSVIILFASILAINIYTNLDTIMLGFMKGDRAVGLYDISCKVKLVLLSLINAISVVLFPRLSFYLSEKKYDDYNKILRKSISIILGIAVPLTLFFEVEAKDVILVLGGNSFIEAVLCMQILMPILIISGFSNIVGNQILLPRGKDLEYMKAVMAGAIIDIILNILFMPKYSLYGAATATLLAEIVQMSIQTFKARDYLKYNFEKKEICKIFVSASGSTLFTAVVRNILHSGSAIANLLLTFALFFFFYILGLVMLKVQCFRELCIQVKKK